MRFLPLYLALHAASLGVLLAPAPVCADDLVGAIPLPGGVRAALGVLRDPVAPDRSQFLVEVIRRTYATPIAVRTDPRDAALQALLAHLERAARTAAVPSETIPLPLTTDIWTSAVFGGGVTADTMAVAILKSRNASLLYYALLSLDEPTRRWISTDRNLIAEIATRHAPVFAIAAAGFRVAEGRVRVPGGPPADAAWETLIGKRVNEPAEFLRAVFIRDEGRLAYVLTAMSELTPAQIEIALGPDAGNRAAALRRLSTIFDRLAPGWKVAERTLWRPRRDPALLLADLALDERGVPLLPGSPALWAAVFAGESLDARRAAAVPADGSAAFAALCDQVFAGPLGEQKRRYDAVLFASRVVKRVTAENAVDAADAIRGALKHPALAAVLERARVTDVPVYAAAARRAAVLSAIAGDERQWRAVVQFQGTLALLARMVSRGSISPDRFRDAVTALSALALDQQGEYGGAVARWFAGFIGSPDALLPLLAGSSPASPRYVDWEGTRYTLDLAAAERKRLVRLLGDPPHPYLPAALKLRETAAAIASRSYPRGGVRADTQHLESLVGEIGSGRPAWLDALSALAERGVVVDGDRVGAQVRTAADDMWARGALELAYAVAMGQPEQAVSAADVAQRHELPPRADSVQGQSAWFLPVADVRARGFRISGSVLGLEAALADFSLTRVSARTPPRKPTISSEERAVFIATVPLVESAHLSDRDLARIVSALGAGRARVAALRDAPDAERLASEVPLGAMRRTLLSWLIAHDPPRVNAFLSPLELLWLGLGSEAAAHALNGWGVAGQARMGCLCLQLVSPRVPDMLMGRVNAGLMASGFPDLSLRLAELLAELRMPAALLGGVLASATSDFVNGASSRDEDDRRGLVEFVHGLRADRVEEYLAMLTTGGPLVPPRDDSDRVAGVAPAGRRP